MIPKVIPVSNSFVQVYMCIEQDSNEPIALFGQVRLAQQQSSYHVDSFAILDPLGILGDDDETNQDPPF